MSYFKPSRRTQSGFAFIALAGALLWGSCALAADLDPGYAEVPPPIPQQTVSFGSGWYVRGDIGVADDSYQVGIAQSASQANQVGVQITRSHNVAYDLSLGGGYSFTNQLRADVIVDFNQPFQSTVPNQQCASDTSSYICTDTGRFSRYDALINGYYDLGTWSIVTPYVGAGVGVGFGGVHVGQYGMESYSGYVGYQKFAWALMAGLAFDVYNHTKVDIGYRFIDQGSLFGVKLYNNEIRIGVRYMIDN